MRLWQINFMFGYSSFRCRGALSFATLHAADETRWVPYSAHYTEAVSSSGPSGNTSKHSVLDESRSEDGSMLSVSKVEGREVKGKLWLANGEVDDLDYTRQQAIVSAHARLGCMHRYRKFPRPAARL
jgi:hypothetical protein